MATTVKGTQYTLSSGISATDFFTYTVSETATNYSLTLTAGSIFKSARTNAYTVVDTDYSVLTGTGKTSEHHSIGSITIPAKGTLTKTVINTTWSWTKTHSAQSVTITSYATGHTGTKASKTFTIPAKTSYVVSYNVNGGTGSIGNSTKWYNEPLTLSPQKPVKSGYTFKGWATSTAKAGTGETTTTYTGNTKATFYATWELTYSKPTITNLKVERCDVNGDADDEGTYARVSFDWSIFRSSANRYYGGTGNAPYDNNSAVCSINVGGQTLTPTLDGASGSYSGVVGNGSFGVDDAYSASVTISDTETVQSAKTTTVNGTLSPTKFPMDVNVDGSAIAFLMPAPDPFEKVASPTGDPVENGYYELVDGRYIASTDTAVDSEKTYYSYIDVSGVYLGKNLLLPLDTTASSGTDFDIYESLSVLGWTDVIV